MRILHYFDDYDSNYDDKDVNDKIDRKLVVCCDEETFYEDKNLIFPFYNWMGSLLVFYGAIDRQMGSQTKGQTKQKIKLCSSSFRAKKKTFYTQILLKP